MACVRNCFERRKRGRNPKTLGGNYMVLIFALVNVVDMLLRGVRVEIVESFKRV